MGTRRTRPDGRVDTRRLDTGRVDAGGLDRRTPDDGTGWVDTACWTRTGDRRHGRCLGLTDHGDNARPLDAGWTLHRAAAIWATNQPGQLSGKDYQDGPGHRRNRQLQVMVRRPAGASAHCCPRNDSGRA